jgi:hypothetical protein
MRKYPKSFTVEVKRRPGAAKKPAPFLPAIEEQPAPQPSAAFFKSPEPEPEAPARRILPCLVTEAAIETVQELSTAEPERRRRGPRKQKGPNDPTPLAPRRRGRPRKNPDAAPAVRLVPAEKQTPDAAPPAPIVAFLASKRTMTRRSAVSGLPRGQRWKRRLPKALR